MSYYLPVERDSVSVSLLKALSYFLHIDSVWNFCVVDIRDLHS